MAFEELLIAEGSDWCWWYGPEHDSANRIEFDQLYRSHLANVYRFLGLSPPEELSRPILRIAARDERVAPTGRIHPVIDGCITLKAANAIEPATVSRIGLRVRASPALASSIRR